MKRIQRLEMLTAGETAKALKVSERFLRKLVVSGRVPFYRLSERTLRFDLNELRDYMKHIAESEHLFKKKGKR